MIPTNERQLLQMVDDLIAQNGIDQILQASQKFAKEVYEADDEQSDPETAPEPAFPLIYDLTAKQANALAMIAARALLKTTDPDRANTIACLIRELPPPALSSRSMNAKYAKLIEKGIDHLAVIGTDITIKGTEF